MIKSTQITIKLFQFLPCDKNRNFRNECCLNNVVCNNSVCVNKDFFLSSSLVGFIQLNFILDIYICRLK